MTVAVDRSLNRRRRLAAWTVMVEDGVRRDGDAAQRRAAHSAHAAARAGAKYAVGCVSRVAAATWPVSVGTLARERPAFRSGWYGRSQVVDDCPTLLVGPRLGRLTQRWLQIVDSRLQGSHSEGRRQGLLEGDYYGLREWRPGDSQRWIHWRTSAKLGELAVRQFEQQRSRDLILVLGPVGTRLAERTGAAQYRDRHQFPGHGRAAMWRIAAAATS